VCKVVFISLAKLIITGGKISPGPDHVNVRFAEHPGLRSPETQEKSMSDGSPFELRSIGQVAINVHDLERAIEFYRDVLGLEFLFSAPPQMAFFNCGGVRLLLGVPEEKEFDHPASILYYRVDDIDDAHQKLLARGASFEREPLAVHRTEESELWLAFLRDSEGNPLALMSEVPVA
jgi:methylmalonyl-CoA/ethylmalonyl-CoA epimerase